MRLKSYHSATVESAIRLAHIELGDQAVFLGSRRNDTGGGPQQAYEVTFAVMEDGGGGQAAVSGAEGAARATASVPRSPSRSRIRTGRSAANTANGRAVNHAAAGADAGAFVSWKKFLRQINTRHDQAAAGGTGTAGDQLLPGGTPDPNGTPGPTVALPHWKEFVPTELRERERDPQQRSLTDASRVEETSSAPLNSAPQPTTAPSNGGQAHGGAPAAPTKKKVRPPTGGSESRGMPPTAEEHERQTYSLEKLGAELEELRRMVERQQAGRAPLVLPSRELLGDTRLAALCQGLIDNAVEPSLALDLAAGLQEAAAQGADGKRLAALLAREIRGRFKTDSELGAAGAAPAVAALVGPSGAGKTTAAAKLAFRCGLLRRRRVRLFSVDQLRIGAVEPLQAYAELMNTPLQIVDDFDKLGQELGSPSPTGQGRPELLLIDTPGYGRREWERARRLAAAFLGRGGVDVHLVLDLRTKAEDLRRTIERFSVFRPAKLLFTRLDETTTFGTMLNETVRTGLPLSFVSVGQRVPEDIVPAGEPELLKLLLRNRSTS